MISDIKTAIADKLYERYPSATIYDDDIPQNFKTPSFLISVIEHNYGKRLNSKFRGDVSIDLAYFSDKDVNEVKSDCHDKQVDLLRAFVCVGPFRVQSQQATITDNVLHITGIVPYSEIKAEEGAKMQTQTTNTEI